MCPLVRRWKGATISGIPQWAPRRRAGVALIVAPFIAVLAALPARAQETAAITRGTGDTVAPGQVLTVDVALTSAELDDLETSPDVVLLDCALLTKGEVTLRHIRQRWLTAPVLVIGAHDDFEGSACSMAAEADGLSAGRTPS